MQQKNYRVIIWGIILIAFLLRFLFVGTNPAGLYWDEVSQGNNANFLLHTGFDEHHEFFPLARFIAFGDYKAPVYIYLIIPFMALLGKTALAVRFPSVLFGTLTVFITYLLVKELFFSDKRKEYYALTAAFFLAISPWHIQLSRAAYEGNVATFFSILVVYLFFISLRKNAWVFIASSVSFVLAIYAFNSHRVFVPLLLILLAGVFASEILKRKKQVIIAAIIGIVLLIPFMQFLRTPESKLRYEEVNIFSDTKIVEKSNKDIQDEENTLFAKALHNRRLEYSYEYLKHYFDFFNPDFLFIHGDVNPRFSTEELGELYLWELPLILLGIYYIVMRKDRSSLIIFGWILIAPIAGATARETPHALRGETVVPMYDISAALGFVGLLFYLKKFSEVINKTFYAVCGIGIAVSLFFFQYIYYIDYPFLYSGVWQDGYKETLEKVQTIQNNYQKIAFDDYYGRSYAYILFYTDISPEEYWQHAKVVRDQFGLYNVYSLGKYTILDGVTPLLKPEKGVLYVVAPLHVQPWMKVIDTIKMRGGQKGFILATI